jgi:hypothetical protein
MRKTIMTSLIATGGMTLFSYLLSKILNKQFLEPLLLNQLVFYRQKEKKKHHATGYLIHYGVGLFFTSIYRWFWKKKPSLQRNSASLTLGFINGMIGITGWHLTFLLHPSPPKVDKKKYHIQLLAAHVVFGVLNGWSYRNMKQGSLKIIASHISRKDIAEASVDKQNM